MMVRVHKALEQNKSKYENEQESCKLAKKNILWLSGRVPIHDSRSQIDENGKQSPPYHFIST